MRRDDVMESERVSTCLEFEVHPFKRFVHVQTGGVVKHRYVTVDESAGAWLLRDGNESG